MNILIGTGFKPASPFGKGEDRGKFFGYIMKILLDLYMRITYIRAHPLLIEGRFLEAS